MSALSSLLARAVSGYRMRAVDQLGIRARIHGEPYVLNSGRITIGDDFELRSRPVRSHLVVGPGARLAIGARVSMGGGTAISCEGGVQIGDDVRFGNFCMLMDSDFHVAGSDERPVPRPIRIDAGVRLGHRVVVLPGTHIGAGTAVAAGSVVSGSVPAGVHIAGNPARIRSEHQELDQVDAPLAVAQVVQRALSLPHTPQLEHTRDQIPAWDSLGALRVALELEDAFSITLAEDDLRRARSIGDLAQVVSDAQARKQAPALSHG